MAEALAQDTFEGKQLADLCGGCDTNLAVKWCDECPVKLCTTCAKSHQKLAFTKAHVLTDIIKTAPSSDVSSDKGTCRQHNGQPYTNMCKECVQLLCSSCNPEHKGHCMVQLGNDVKLYQRVTSKHIQILLDNLHELDEVKTLLEGNIITYKEAIGIVDQWEVDILKTVKQKASGLRKQLAVLRDESSKALTDSVNGLLTKLCEVDKSLTRLTDIRKSMDCNTLGRELAETEALIVKLESYKMEIQPLPHASEIDDILPNIKNTKEVDDALEISLTFHKIVGGPIPVAEWKFTKSNNGKDVSKYSENPIEMTGINNSDGPSGDANGAIILPKSEDQLMVVLNPTSKLGFDKEMTFCTQLYTEGKEVGPLFYYYSERAGKGARLWLLPDHTSLAVHGIGCEVEAHNVLTSNKWHKIATVLTASNVSIYVDGNLVKSENVKVNFFSLQKRQVYIGCRPKENRRVQGKMSYAKFYDVALTEDEVKRLC